MVRVRLGHLVSSALKEHLEEVSSLLNVLMFWIMWDLHLMIVSAGCLDRMLELMQLVPLFTV
jgi:hypothetical protein